MKKLQRIWNDMQEPEKFIKRNRLTLYEFHEVARICDALNHGITDTTICADVKKVFEKYGFGVFTEGIGWRIKLNRQPKKMIDEILNSVYGEKLNEITEGK